MGQLLACRPAPNSSLRQLRAGFLPHPLQAWFVRRIPHRQTLYDQKQQARVNTRRMDSAGTPTPEELNA